MRVIKKKPYSYVLMEFEGDWVLTFLLGGPVELDVSVTLTDDEINKIKSDDSSVDHMVNDFKSNKALYESRKVVPTIWPSKQR